MERSRPSKIVVVLNDNHGRIVSYCEDKNTSLVNGTSDYMTKSKGGSYFSKKAQLINQLIINEIIKGSSNRAEDDCFNSSLFFAFLPYNDQFAEQSVLFTSSSQNNIHLEALVYVRDADKKELVKRAEQLSEVDKQENLLKNLPIKLETGG